MHVAENSAIHIERSEKPIIHIPVDRAAESTRTWMHGIFRHIHVLVLCHAWFF
jgi:hypothetical protein